MLNAELSDLPYWFREAEACCIKVRFLETDAEAAAHGAASGATAAADLRHRCDSTTRSALRRRPRVPFLESPKKSRASPAHWGQLID